MTKITRAQREKPAKLTASETQPAGAKPSTTKPAAKGKIPILVDMLRSPDGATIAAMMSATGWQAHSVRGAISGSIKKVLSLEVLSQKTDAGRVYRIAAETQA